MSSNEVKIPPVLLFAYGNPSRGDDAIGPKLLEAIAETDGEYPEIEFLTDFQLQIEHALDLTGRRLILFADATVAGTAAFEFTELEPEQDKSYTSHAMSPAAVLAVYRQVNKQPPPPAFLLAIKGESFELGESLSAAAQVHLAQALEFSRRLLRDARVEVWRQYLTEPTGCRKSMVNPWG